MWSSLPFDLLAKVFFFLSPDSLARSRSVCHHWRTCADAYPLSSWPSMLHHHQQQPPWFVAFPTRNRKPSYYVHNPVSKRWHVLSLELLSNPIRIIASIGSLILLRATNSTVLVLSICNPFTRQFRHLPVLNIARTNPAVGVVVLSSSQYSPSPHFRVYVAGGMSDAPGGGATYESTVDMYDSKLNTWQIVGPMPVEFSVRLTVWTPNESVYIDGVIYWMTSARAYSVMGYEIVSNKWQELRVPMADKLEFAALAQHNGRLTLVGGNCRSDACVWELNEGEIWRLIEKAPIELGMKLKKGNASWDGVKCVGGDGAICLYRELGSGMVLWREDGEKGRWGWSWIEGCCFISGKQVQSVSIRGVIVHPNIAPSPIFVE